jgi:hypothetical protein
MRSEHDHLDDANPLASVISGMPEVWQRLLDEHVPDPSGRCGACRSSATAGVLWPCTLRVIADDAKAICLGAGSRPGESLPGESLPGSLHGEPLDGEPLVGEPDAAMLGGALSARSSR